MRTDRFPPVSVRVASLIRNPWRFKDAKRGVTSIARFRRVVEKRTKAALLIQRVWRGVFCFRGSRRVVREFLAVGLSSEYVRGVSIQSATAKLMDTRVILATQACLRYVHFFVAFLQVSPSDLRLLSVVGLRPFLASFRFAFHRDAVFEDPTGRAETALFEAAVPLVAQFERVLRLVVECGGNAGVIPLSEGYRFGPLFLEYLKLFHEWRQSDQPRRIEKLQGSLVTLHAELAYAVLDEGRRARMQAEIGSLRSRLRKLVDEESMRAIDAECLTRPEYRDGMTYAQLAHELLLDPTFRLDTQLRKGSIRTRLHQSVWANITDEIQRLSFLGVFSVLREIRLRLLKLGGFEACEAFPAELIRAQDGSGTLEWDGCTELVASATAVVLRMRPSQAICLKATVIETAMREAQPDQYARVFVSALQFVFSGIEDLEDAHPTSRLIAPRVVEQGVDCERGRFDDQLAAGSLTLERTTAWIRAAIERGVQTHATGLLELAEGKEAAYIRVHSLALVALVVDSVAPITPLMCPETLLLDVDRLEQSRQEFRQAVAAITLSVSATRFLTEKGNPMVDRPVLLQMQAYLVCARPLDNPQGVIDDLKAMLLRTSLEDNVRALCVQTMLACLKSDDALHALMARRTRNIWERILMGGRAVPTADMTSTSLLVRVEKAAASLLAVAKLNRVVYLLHYRGIVVDTARALLVES